MANALRSFMTPARQSSQTSQRPGRATPLPRLHSPRWPNATHALTALATSAVLALGALTSLPAHADDHADHEQARAARLRGEIRPLAELMARLQRERPGDVLEVELERSRGRWIYEIKQIEAGGQIVKLRLDALSGDILDVKAGRGQRTNRPNHD